MTNTIGGMALLCGSLLLLALPSTGILDPGWRSLRLDEMAEIRGGDTCAYNDQQACDGHGDDCGTACEDHDDNKETPEVCVRRGQRKYVEDSSQAAFPFCQFSSQEDGYNLCEDEETRTVCYESHECKDDCKLVGLDYECEKLGTDIQDEGVHDTYDVDTSSGTCEHE